MPNVHSPDAAIYILQILVSAFLAVLFLQSGIDKVVDRRGNREYLNEHFAKSPLAGQVRRVFPVPTFLRISAGAPSRVRSGPRPRTLANRGAYYRSAVRTAT